MGTVALDAISRRLRRQPAVLDFMPRRQRHQGLGGTPGESEREELALLRRQDAEKNMRISELEMEMERDVLKRCMVLWVK